MKGLANENQFKVQGQKYDRRLEKLIANMSTGQKYWARILQSL